MDFTLGEKYKALQASVRKMAVEKLAPVAGELDRKQQFAWGNFKLLGEMGLLGLTIPTRYGGAGSDMLATLVANEEIAWACCSTADILDAHLGLCTEPIYFYGTEAQRQKYVVPLATGKKVGAFAITEPDAGSDVSAIKTTAVRDGDSYVVNGTKAFITNGETADIAVIFASVPALGKRGMTAFIVDTTMKGFTKGKVYDKVGMRAVTNSELVFKDCRVPAENRLGEEGQGMKICLSTLDRGRISVAGQGLGITRAALEMATDYSKKRVQFGGPISNNQAIQWMLADIATGLEAARLLALKAAVLCDQGEPFGLIAAMAKVTATELAMKASTEGIQILGGYGYMMDSPMQRYFRDAKLTTIYEGTSEVQRMVISRGLLK